MIIIDAIMNYVMQAPILYIIICLLLIAYLVKVFFDPSFLFRSLRAVWFSLVETFKQMKSIRGIIALLISYLTLSGAILIPIAMITNTPALYHIATAMMIFWSMPLITPLIPITILVSMVITKYIFRDKRINMGLVLKRFLEELKPGGKK